jgi:hypothetical protein
VYRVNSGGLSQSLKTVVSLCIPQQLLYSPPLPPTRISLSALHHLDTSLFSVTARFTLQYSYYYHNQIALVAGEGQQGASALFPPPHASRQNNVIMCISRTTVRAALYAYTCSPLLIFPLLTREWQPCKYQALHAQWCMRMGLPYTNASGLITYAFYLSISSVYYDLTR